MTDEQKAAYVYAQAISAHIALHGMAAANQERLAQGHSLAYPESAFIELQNEYCISHNAVLELFKQ